MGEPFVIEEEEDEEEKEYTGDLTYLGSPDPYAENIRYSRRIRRGNPRSGGRSGIFGCFCLSSKTGE